MERNTTVMEKHRRKELDYAKGFAILLMLFSHCIPSESIVKTWISSFNMPIFFVICGILQADKNPEGIKLKEAFKFLLKRCKQLLIPYFIFGIGLIILYQILYLVGGSALTYKEQLVSLITLRGIGSMWFIPCYLISECIFVFFLCKLPDIIRLLFILGTIVMIVITNSNGMLGEAFFGGYAIGIVFIYVGFCAERYQLVKKCSLPVAAILLMICNISAQLNGFVGIGALQLQNAGLFFMNGILESMAVIVICSYIEKRVSANLVEMFGKNTIIVVCTNNILIEVIRLVDYKFTGNLLINWGMVGNVVFFAILVICESLFITVAKGKLRWIFGKIS